MNGKSNMIFLFISILIVLVGLNVLNRLVPNEAVTTFSGGIIAVVFALYLSTFKKKRTK